MMSAARHSDGEPEPLFVGASRTASPNIDATLKDALQDSLQTEVMSVSPASDQAASPETAAAAAATSQTSPFAAPGASEAVFGDLSKPEADKWHWSQPSQMHWMPRSVSLHFVNVDVDAFRVSS